MNTVTSTSSQHSGGRQLLGGIATGIVVVATVLAGGLLASQESSGPTPTRVALATLAAIATLPPSASPTHSASNTPGPSVTPSPSTTPIPTIACPVPVGWTTYVVRQGDTLASIAQANGANIFLMIQGNCLVNPDVTPGQTLYLPPVPTRAPGPTPTRTPCGPPPNWVMYHVQPGDTLYGLALRYGTTVSALAQANCLIGYTLRVGQGIYVPFYIVIPPPATRTRAPSVTPSATTPGITPPTPTATVASPTPTWMPTVTATPPIGPSPTPPPVTPTASDTSQPPTHTPTASPSVPPSDTPVPPSATPTVSPLPPSATLPPTASPLPPSATLPPTATPLPPTATPVPTSISPPTVLMSPSPES